MIRHILTCAVITVVLSTWSISIKVELKMSLVPRYFYISNQSIATGRAPSTLLCPQNRS